MSQVKRKKQCCVSAMEPSKTLNPGDFRQCRCGRKWKKNAQDKWVRK